MIGKARIKLLKQATFYTFNLKSCLQCGQLEDEKLQDPERLLPAVLFLEICVCVYVYLWTGLKESMHVYKLYDK